MHRLSGQLGELLDKGIEHEQAAAYLGKHLIGILEFPQQDGNLGLIGGSRKELCKAPLHALHLDLLDVKWRTTRLLFFTAILIRIRRWQIGLQG